ncbi:MAG TPA: hypothetical protein VGL81_33585 [Polyangiaceae bacterium]
MLGLVDELGEVSPGVDEGGAAHVVQAGTPTQAGAQPDAPGPREGTYSGAYVLVSGSGHMLLVVSADGTVTLIPKDVNAAATGTIDPSGNVDVTTGYDTFAESTLTFTGTVSLVDETWKASGAVAGITSDSSGTWTATQ